jgi:aldose sugar dehydrogenase
MRRVGACIAAAVALIAAPAASAAITAQPVATGLAFPAAFTFAPDGRIFYGERFSGEIRVYNPVTDTDTLFFSIPNVVASGEQGLLGIALHPSYPTAPYVFAFATRNTTGTPRNHILRLTDGGGTASSMHVILSAPAGTVHNGGRILFGPDRQLYAVIGENGSPGPAQNLASNVGKVLRMSAWGKVPAGNPFAGSLVWAYGIRNSFGMGFDPETDRLWESDNGPRCNDELNRIARGRNYGWGPSQTCSTPPEPPMNTNQDGPDPVLPKLWWGTPIAPTGLAFCSGCGLGAGSEGRLFLGAWKTGELRRITLGPLRWSATSESVVYTHPRGILSIEVAPDGTLYLSDQDGIYRLVLSP